jgi:hypothetical protein
MKMKRFIITLLLLAILLSCVGVSATERKLTMDRAIMINDSQIVVEFSEPIAMNKFETHPWGTAPWISVRLVDSSGGLQRITDAKSPYYDVRTQWGGSVMYVDSKHDRLIFTFAADALGVNTLMGVINREGLLADFEKCNVVFSLEELPYDAAGHYSDGRVCNVTTRDGEVYLTPTRFSGYESCNIPIEIDYNYKVDLSATEPTQEKKEIVFDYSLAVVADDATIADEAAEEAERLGLQQEKPMDRVLKNDPILVAAILGGSALLSLLLVVIAVVIRKKRRVA